MLLVALLFHTKLQLMKNLTMLYKQHAFMHEAYLPKAIPCIWSEIQPLNVKQVQLRNTQAYAPLTKFTKIEILKLMYEFLIL